jgi:hypothetical protein
MWSQRSTGRWATYSTTARARRVTTRTAGAWAAPYDSDGKKRFTQSGHTNGARTTLYRLAEVQKAAQNNEPILLVESEKDVLAGNFHNADPTPLYGAQVMAIAHDDESGEKWARQVVAALDGKASALHGARIMQRLAEPRPGHPRSPTSLHRPLSC